MIESVVPKAPHLKRWARREFAGQRVIVAMRLNDARDEVEYLGWIFRQDGTSARGSAGDAPVVVGWDKTEHADRALISQPPSTYPGAAREWAILQKAPYGVEFDNGDAVTVLAMRNEIDALRKAHALQTEADNAHIARLQDEIVALKMQMHADRDTCRNAIREIENERDALRDCMEPEYRAMAQEIAALRATGGGVSNS